MVFYLLTGLVVGGVFGMLGMAMFACNSKVGLIKDHIALCNRLEFLEREAKQKRISPVQDPRPHVHSLVN